MGIEIASFLKAIPSAAQSSYGVVVFLATLTAWVFLSIRVRRNKQLLKRIDKFPPEDRRKLVQAEMGAPVPPDLSPGEWLQSQVNRYYFVGFITLVVCTSGIFTIAYLIKQPTSRVDASISLYEPQDQDAAKQKN